MTYIITPFESRILSFTSILFSVPAIYALNNNMYFYGVFSIFTASISLMYWWKPVLGWRRNLDSFYAKLTFVLYTGSGILYVPLGFPTFVFYLGVFLLVYFHLLSCAYFPIQGWVFLHAVFHLTSIFVKLWILYYMVKIDNMYCHNPHKSLYSMNYC